MIWFTFQHTFFGDKIERRIIWKAADSGRRYRGRGGEEEEGKRENEKERKLEVRCLGAPPIE